jgi:two-component system cell cycle sensor histidine kinase/response regulator CckA
MGISTSSGKNGGNKTALRQQAEEHLAQRTAPASNLESFDLQRMLHELQVHQVELEMQNTELRLSKLSLEAARDSYFELYDQAPVGYITLNHNNLIQRTNRCALKMMESHAAELQGQSFLSRIHSEDQELFVLYSRRAFQHGSEVNFEIRLRQMSGAPLWVQLHACLRDQGDLWLVMSDASERRRLEQAVHKARHTHAAVASTHPTPLPSALALDVNNLLEIVKGYGETHQNYLAWGEPPLSDEDRALQRSLDLCQQMLACASLRPLEPAELELRPAMKALVHELKASALPNIHLRSVLATSVPKVWGDAAQLMQAVHNLVCNAIEAIGTASGTVTIKLSVLKQGGTSPPDGMQDTQRVPEPCVCLEVCDDGPGLDAAARGDLFKPFVSGKPGHHGLGLAAVRGITLAHQGLLQWSSAPGQGCRFGIVLPALPPGHRSPETSALG